MADATPQPVRTSSALPKAVWKPEPLDVVLVLGFVLLVAGVALRFSIPDALLVAGTLILLGWVRIAYAVGVARTPPPREGR